jgi:xanthine dehydrogenase YagR molybdenum-binding subunit
MKSAARVRLAKSGTVTGETAMTDIGTDSHTIISQTPAKMMGVPLHKAVVRRGNSTHPVSAGSGGQWGANSAAAGVYAASVKLSEAVAKKLGLNSADAVFTDGEVRTGDLRLPLVQAAGDGGLIAEDTI